MGLEGNEFFFYFLGESYFFILFFKILDKIKVKFSVVFKEIKRILLWNENRFWVFFVGCI